MNLQKPLNLEDLDYSFPDELIALEPQRPSRVMGVYLEESTATGKSPYPQASVPVPIELTIPELLEKIPPGDVMVINDTKVLKRRIFSNTGLEILFIRDLGGNCWQVLMPARKLIKNEIIYLPEGIAAECTERGLPQIIRTTQPLTEEYFAMAAELPLPPYIQKERKERHQRSSDDSNYQPAWAEKPGSLASPTASLHFSIDDIARIKNRGVHVVTVTLHVGLGTFLPIKTHSLSDHKMHSEFVEISSTTWDTIQKAKDRDAKIWALGTTAVRAVESAALNLLNAAPAPGVAWQGTSELFIQPGFEFQIVDRLMTNFHQPKTTLLALVSAFADLTTVKEAYAWAIERKYRLFSYGDLTVWWK